MPIIIPALNYADMLAVTLPAWRALQPDAQIVVITGPDDQAAVEVAQEHRAFLVKTDAWTRGGATLDKAAALDAGLNFPGLFPGDVCVVADADCYPFGGLPCEDMMPNVIYGCVRYYCDHPSTLDRHRAGIIPRDRLTLIPPRRGGEPEYGRWALEHAAAECTGYFQMFRHRPGLTFGSYPTAAGYDLAFRNQFTHRVGLTDFYVLHLGELSRENWKGRVVPRWPPARDSADERFPNGLLRLGAGVPDPGSRVKLAIVDEIG